MTETTSQAPAPADAPEAEGLPQAPVLVHVRRGAHVESQHRGSWVVVDAEGAVLASGGHPEHPVYSRSAIKSLQALPLLESGAAERWALTDEELAVCVSSHEAEPCHTDTVLGLLAKIGLGVGDLRCGPQVPGDLEVRRRLAVEGAAPSPLHNNCSGKHAGFLALAVHLGAPPAEYLAPDGAVQRLVRRSVLELAGLEPAQVTLGTDGCSAPTFRFPLTHLALAFARLAKPAGLAPERRAHCERLRAAVAARPELVAGSRGRLDTDLVRASGGRLFAKIGAEAVYAVGEAGGGRALAVKIDDGGRRALAPLVLALLERFDFLAPAELAALAPWTDPTLRNRAGLDVGRTEVVA